MTRPRIAIVEDDASLLHLLDVALTHFGYEVFLLHSRAEAERELAGLAPALVILDLWLEEREDGWEMAEKLHGALAGLPLIICSADTKLLQERADRLKQWDWTVLEKPFDLDALIATIEGCLHQMAS